MWFLIFIFCTMFLSLSLSPFLALFILIFMAFSMSIKAGFMYMNWFFFSILIMYVGGMMVMFMFMSSLVSSFKINLLNINPLYFLQFFVLAVFMKEMMNPFLKNMISWLNMSFSSGCNSMMIMYIFFLLMSLIMVLMICEKTEGPLKSLNL